MKKQHELVPRLAQIGKGSYIDPGAIIEEPENISIGENVIIKAGVVLRPENGSIHIGNHVTINHFSVIHGKGEVEIGDWSMIAPHVGIFAQNHCYSSFKEPITLQENTGYGITLMGDNWIGANSVILDNVTLGKGTIVDAGAVVTKSFPMGYIISGNPAEKIKERLADNTKWQHVTEERFSPLRTPDEYLDYVEQRAEYAKRFLHKDDLVLDVGCGEGYITNKLRENCQRIIGIDYSEDALKVGKKLYNLEAFHMNTTHLVFDDNLFDKVICFEVLEHLTRLQARKTLSEIHRVLTKGGLLIGSTPIRTTPSSEPKLYAHIYEYSKAELQQILCEKFKIRQIENTFFLAEKS